MRGLSAPAVAAPGPRQACGWGSPRSAVRLRAAPHAAGAGALIGTIICYRSGVLESTDRRPVGMHESGGRDSSFSVTPCDASAAHIA